ncbi:MAG: hypothetical protein ACQEQE_05170 [Bacillota bacterium]
MKDILKRLIKRYDYVGAYEVLNERDLEETDLAILINSTRYALNFDFETSKRILYEISDDLKENYILKDLERNLQDLIDGKPDELFSELIYNTNFQLLNKEYIDFLGRIYRFREAIFKYIFVRFNDNKKSFSLHTKAMEKREILKKLRKKYRINNGNVVYGVENYIRNYCSDEYKINKVSDKLTSKKIKKLISLRNDSIVGHGFIGISKNDIYKIYGTPSDIIRDFKKCLNTLGFVIDNDKYKKINLLLLDLLEELNGKIEKGN